MCLLSISLGVMRLVCHKGAWPAYPLENVKGALGRGRASPMSRQNSVDVVAKDNVDWVSKDFITDGWDGVALWPQEIMRTQFI